jgi:alpha-L-fucosidase
VPWIEGDQVRVVGGKMDGAVVPSMKIKNGTVVLSVSEEMAKSDHFAWVFKIAY